MTNIELSLYTEEELYWAKYQLDKQKTCHNLNGSDEHVNKSFDTRKGDKDETEEI
ncbi:hypothetical protein ACJ2A9_21595 [Anaerobacillus sp. MEB173]|uniref:hypothetical protein n=1 Tax=Anaerobacillus sp. MEB173 TaxID=3383345 RepID=UPI003F907128